MYEFENLYICITVNKWSLNLERDYIRILFLEADSRGNLERATPHFYSIPVFGAS